MGQHGCGQVSNEGKSLGVQILKHCVRFPVADEADGVGVDLTAEERHGPSHALAAGVDVGSGETEACEGMCRGMEDCGEVIGGES